MTFQDFLEHCAAQIGPFNEYGRKFNLSIPPLSDSHIFYLGEDEAVAKSSQEIKEDLHEEISSGVPMPFEDISCISMVDGVWNCDRIISTSLPFDISELEPSVKGTLLKEIKPEGYLIIRQQEPSAHVPLIWPVVFWGVLKDRPLTCLTLQTDWFSNSDSYLKKASDPAFIAEVIRMANRDTSEILWDVAIISHPQNYIVKVTPELTPREERHLKKGSPRPIRKSQHFIVVDHDVLVEMSRKDPVGTHSSPVPHHRRGHWKRLAERCRHARLLGQDKVFVRPTFVGERTFSTEKNHYEVLLDFGKRAALVP